MFELLDTVYFYLGVISNSDAGKTLLPILFFAVGLVLIVRILNLTEIFRTLLKILEPIPISHKIAVIGLPGAGKTTLITALFEEIQRGGHISHARIHGSNTIKRINKNIALLNSGEKLPPTAEKDIFVFRFSYFIRNILIRFNYDVEIADFPGEYSQEISSNPPHLNNDDPFSATVANKTAISSSDSGYSYRYNSSISDRAIDLDYTLFNREFFSWIASSRIYIFVIDLTKIYSEPNTRKAIAEISAMIRTSWQVIEDSVSERGLGNTRSKGVIIAFSKFDALLDKQFEKTSEMLFERGHSADPDALSHAREQLARLGSRADLFADNKCDDEAYQNMIRNNNSAFGDLIGFFKSRSQSAQPVYISMLYKSQSGSRMGIAEILRQVTPRS